MRSQKTKDFSYTATVSLSGYCFDGDKMKNGMNFS